MEGFRGLSLQLPVVNGLEGLILEAGVNSGMRFLSSPPVYTMKTYHFLT